MGSLWWEGGFPCWWVPLGYIPNQMRPISHDWCDFFETCNFRQMVLDKRFSPRHYRSPLFKPWCDIGPQPCNLMKSDGLGPDFTLGLVHITLWRLNKTLNKGNKSWCPNTTPFHLPKVSFGLHPFNLEITLLFIYFMVGDGNFTLPHFDLSWPTLPHRFSLPCRGGRGIKRDFSFTYGGARNDLDCPTL